MSIKKPSAVESPYVTIDTTPTRLASKPVAGGGVNTVAADVAQTVSANANANANTTSSSTGSNVSYYTSGIEGIAGLANYGRVFDGANVYVTLEQPQYITYNQNYTGSGTVGGANGQVQFNNNGNFAGSANLTFNGSTLSAGAINTGNLSAVGITAGNVITPTVYNNGMAMQGYDYVQMQYSNAVALPVSTYDLGTGSWFYLDAGGAVFESNTTGNIKSMRVDNNGNISATGNITGNYFIGNGSQLTGISGGSSNKIFNGNSYANIANASGNVVVGANGNIWTFGADGTTEFPNNVINPGNNQPLTIRTQSSGNAYTIMYQSSNSWEAYAEDDNTEANSAYAWIKADLNTANTPRVFINNVRGGDGLSATWTFDDAGNLTLPDVANVSINYANGSPYGGSGTANTGNVTFNDINIIGTGNLHLQPDANNSGAYLDIYLTTGPDIHIAKTDSNVIIGADSAANVTVNALGNVSIQSWNGTAHVWDFGADGNLTVPGNSTIGTPIATGGAGGNSVTIRAGSSDTFASAPGGDLNLIGGYGSFGDGGGPPGGNVNIVSGGSYDLHPGNVTITTGVSNRTWTFDYNGNLAVPGGMVINGNTNIFGTDTALIQTADNVPMTLLSSGANAGVTSIWVSNISDPGNSAIAGMYTPLTGTGNVRIVTGNNAGTVNFWDFGTDGNLTTPGSSGDISGVNTISAVNANLTGNLSASGSTNISNVTINSYSSVPKLWFKGALSAAQNIVSSTDTVTVWNNNSDPLGWGNVSTGHITPTQAGWYEITSRVQFSTNAASNAQIQINHQIAVNDTSQAISQLPNSTANVPITMITTAMANLNGTTDYITTTSWSAVAGNAQQINGGTTSMLLIRWVSN